MLNSLDELSITWRAAVNSFTRVLKYIYISLENFDEFYDFLKIFESIFVEYIAFLIPWFCNNVNTILFYIPRILYAIRS